MQRKSCTFSRLSTLSSLSTLLLLLLLLLILFFFFFFFAVFAVFVSQCSQRDTTHGKDEKGGGNGLFRRQEEEEAAATAEEEEDSLDRDQWMEIIDLSTMVRCEENGREVAKEGNHPHNIFNEEEEPMFPVGSQERGINRIQPSRASSSSARSEANQFSTRSKGRRFLGHTTNREL